MRPSQAILVLEALDIKYPGPLSRKGVELSSDDNRTTREVYQQWLLLLIDLGYLHHDELRSTGGLLYQTMLEKDILDLNSAFAELLGSVRNQENKGFKALCSRISCHLFNIIKDDFKAVIRGDVISAGRLVQIFSYTSRLTLTDIDLTKECLTDYMNIESSIDESYYSTSVTSSLNKIIKRWTRSFDPSRFQFQHGPKGVAGHGRKASMEDKYKDLTTDPLLNYAFGSPWWVQQEITSSLDRISHTVFVPKSYKTFRTISMEATTLMYLQQGVWREIDRVVDSSTYLRDRIGFREQNRNQQLAQEGSLNRNYATIDLSSASDSVSYSLVKKLFKGTGLLRFLVATRSSRTLLPDGRLVDLKKFAPMGSALCFPVETMIFASICEHVTREHGFSGDFSVVGDDIIVPTQCASDVMYVLESLGFSVNRSKSFYHPDNWFRESCGGEYCDGYDVSPLKVSRKYAHTEQLERLSGLTDLSNEAYYRGFKNLRSFFLKKLRDNKFIAHFDPNGVVADNYSNYHTERRWDSDLQRIELWCTKLVTETKPHSSEQTRLRHWFESTQHRLTRIEKLRPYVNPSKLRELRRREFYKTFSPLVSFGDGFVASIGKTTVYPSGGVSRKFYEELDQPFIDFYTTGK